MSPRAATWNADGALRRVARLALGVVWLLSASGCLVSRPAPAVWSCSTDPDCLDGYACRARAGDRERTCSRRCVVDGDCGPGAQCLLNGACALECSFDADGRPVVACPDGLYCSRLDYPLSSAQAGPGLCGIEPTCATDVDCQPEGGPAPDELELRCSSSALAAVRGLSNLPCLPVPTETACPAGWVATEQGCLPNCDAERAVPACPPAMTCYEGRLASVGASASASACFFGFYGAPCRDDVECFVGECLEIEPGRRQCTVPCDEAARLSAEPREIACARLHENAGPFGVRLLFDCASASPAAVCVARAGVGGSCRQSADCGAGLVCGDDGLCTRECLVHEDCVATGTLDPNPLATGYCEPESGLCRRRLPESSQCDFDAECETSLCSAPLLALGTERRCGRPRAVGAPCGRDAECTSRRCARSGMFLVGFCEER